MSLNYCAAGKEYEDCLVENAFFQDLWEVFLHVVQSFRCWWPKKSILMHVLDRIGRRNITWLDIYIAGEPHGMTPKAAMTLIDFYAPNEYMESTRKKSRQHAAACQLASDLQLSEPSMETFDKIQQLWTEREATLLGCVEHSVRASTQDAMEDLHRHNAELAQRHMAELNQRQEELQHTFSKVQTARLDHLRDGLGSVQVQLTELLATRDAAARDSALALLSHLQELERQVNAGRQQFAPAHNHFIAGALHGSPPSTVAPSAITYHDRHAAGLRAHRVPRLEEGARAQAGHQDSQTRQAEYQASREFEPWSPPAYTTIGGDSRSTWS